MFSNSDLIWPHPSLHPQTPHHLYPNHPYSLAYTPRSRIFQKLFLKARLSLLYRASPSKSTIVYTWWYIMARFIKKSALIWVCINICWSSRGKWVKRRKVILNRSCYWNVIGCFIVVFSSHWLGEISDSEQKLVGLVNKLHHECIKGPLVAAFRSPLMKVWDKSVKTLGLWILTSWLHSLNL